LAKKSARKLANAEITPALASPSLNAQDPTILQPAEWDAERVEAETHSAPPMPAAGELVS
jgi:hypothetical protein